MRICKVEYKNHFYSCLKKQCESSRFRIKKNETVG